MNKIISLLLVFVLLLTMSGKIYAESMDIGTRIAIVAGSVFGVWLGHKLFHKKDKVPADSTQKQESKKESIIIKEKPTGSGAEK